MRKLCVCITFVCCLSLALSQSGNAQGVPAPTSPESSTTQVPSPAEKLLLEVNYPELFRERALNCVHPTVNTKEATIEVLKGPDQEGDTITTRLKVYYQGLLRRNTMEVDLMVRRSGTVRQMRIKVLSDTSMIFASCALEEYWLDF